MKVTDKFGIQAYPLAEMTATDGSHVIVVLDPEYGERVVELAPKGPVWMLDTPTNRDAVRKSKRSTGTFDLHLFKAPDGVPHGSDLIDEDLLAEIFIDHFMRDYQRCKTLELVGAFLDEETKTRLSHFRFEQFEATADGFRAVLGDAVPDETTALSYARWHFNRSLGEQEVNKFQHFEATLAKGTWIVQGTSESGDAGQLQIRINKVDGIAYGVWRSFSITEKPFEDEISRWIVFAVIQIAGLVLAWDGNVHGLFVFGLLMLLPSSPLVFLSEGQLGGTSYHALLIVAACVNGLALWASTRWHRRSPEADS